MTGAKLLFLATEDWFVRSHFMALLRRAREEGYEVVVAARLSGADLEGGRAVHLPIERGAIGPRGLAREIGAVRDLVRREQPDVVHAIALKPIVWALLAGGSAARVLALTGRGYLAARRTPATMLASALMARWLRAALSRRGALLVENEADRRWVEHGAPLPDARAITMPGAGIDPAIYAPAPEAHGPVVVGMASRLVWSKGVDIAVEAVRQLRNQGVDVILRIAGAPDADNPGRVRDAEIERWRAHAGVEWIGRVDDMNAFWERAHIACLPSRGGEGLPRTLLEAAACGRPIVASAVPGITDFVTPDIGLLAPANDPAALAEAIARLAANAALRKAMGLAAREKVLTGYCERHAADCAARAWAAALLMPPGPDSS